MQQQTKTTHNKSQLNKSAHNNNTSNKSPTQKTAHNKSSTQKTTSDKTTSQKTAPENKHSKIELLIYNSPFEKTYTTNTGALIQFTTKQSSKGRLYKLTDKCSSKNHKKDINKTDTNKKDINKTDNQQHNDNVCLNNLLEKEEQVNSRFLFNVSNTTIVEERPMFYILEYYYYDIIPFPSEIYELTSSKKFDNISQILMFYPEILFPRELESPTIIDDYIERYIPSYNSSLSNTYDDKTDSKSNANKSNANKSNANKSNANKSNANKSNICFKYMSYNETINFKINHSIIQLGIRQEDYINFSPKQFLEYLEHIYSIQTTEKKDLIQQYQEQIKIIDIE